MAKKSLRAQLNQIRAWVRQGRTDAWIAHQLEVPAAELREFKRRHDLAAGGEEPSETDLRDEIEAEIEAATLAEREAEEEEEEEEEEEAADEQEAEAAEEEEAEAAEEQEERAAEEEPAPPARGEGRERAERGRATRDEEGDEGDRPRRRRRRRGRRGRGRRKALEATFDHGEKEGYGLWLDPAVGDDPVYSEHWAGHRAVEVDVEPDRITIRRV